MLQVGLFKWEFFVFNLYETPNFSSKMDWLEQSRQTEVPPDKYGPSGILSCTGPQRLEMKFLPRRGQGVLEPRVKVICWGTWLLSGTTQTQLSCVKFPLQAAALSIPSWSSQFHADPLDPCKLVLSAFPGLGLILIGFILFLCCALSQALFWCRTEQTLFCQCRCCSSVE